MSLIDPTIAIAPPRLPPELIDEILRENELSNSDLARCCLVSRQFLPSARRSLYNKVEVNLVYAGHNGNPAWVWKYLDSSSKSWRTLKENLPLRKLCCGLLVDDNSETGKIDCEKVARDPEEVTREWLELLEGVRNLSSSTSAYVDPAVRERRWNTLHLGLSTLRASLPASVQTSGVKRLKLSQDSWGETIRDLTIPSTVITFDYSTVGYWKVLPTKNPQLRNLSINLYQTDSIDFSVFPNLAYLSLSAYTLRSINPKCLSPLTRLHRLSLEFESLPDYFSDFLKSFLSNLPPSVHRLDFRKAVPSTILTPMFNGKHFSITQLGLSERVNSDPARKEELVLLKETCRWMGIELYYLGKEDPIFAF